MMSFKIVKRRQPDGLRRIGDQSGFKNKSLQANENWNPIDSFALYNGFWISWQILGVNTKWNKYHSGTYNILLTIFVTIAYPTHLIIGLFMNRSLNDLFKNLSISLTCAACSIKHLIMRYKLKEIQEMQQIMAELDRRTVDNDERKYFNKTPRTRAQQVSTLFFYVYVGCNVTATMLTIFSSERRIMYPAWLPFDWRTNNLTYWAAFAYQFAGVSYQIVQNYANDLYAPMSLCIVGGHVRLLAMRFAKIGHNGQKSMEESYQELNMCIRDHKKLIEVIKLLQSTVSYGQFVQFLSSAMIICVTLVYLLFYCDNIYAYLYYIVYLTAMGIEIFPCCYYGSLLEQELCKLPYAIFSCDWVMQEPKYRKNMLIFTELSLRDIQLSAGGFIGINLNAFFGICKMAYSMFTVVLTTK